MLCVLFFITRQPNNPLKLRRDDIARCTQSDDLKQVKKYAKKLTLRTLNNTEANPHIA